MAAYDRTEWVPNPSSGASWNDPEGPPHSDGGPHERLGPYRLLEEIGEGGMGVVHLALDSRGRAVAIKVLRAHVAHDSDARTRLGPDIALQGNLEPASGGRSRRCRASATIGSPA